MRALQPPLRVKLRPLCSITCACKQTGPFLTTKGLSVPLHHLSLFTHTLSQDGRPSPQCQDWQGLRSQPTLCCGLPSGPVTLCDGSDGPRCQPLFCGGPQRKRGAPAGRHHGPKGQTRRARTTGEEIRRGTIVSQTHCFFVLCFPPCCVVFPSLLCVCPYAHAPLRCMLRWRRWCRAP